MERGKFIVFDGGEGGGKSTAIAYVSEFLKSRAIDVVCTREPGGTSVGEKLRELVLDHKQDGISIDTETLIMFGARSEHLAKVIIPSLEAGKWVLCDRFTSATYAYQSGGRGVSEDRIAALESWVQGTLRPDLTIIMDLPVSVGMERAGKRGALDRMEKESSSFFERVRSNFLDQAKADPDRYRVVDASRGLSDVENDIKAIFEGLV